MTQKLTKLEHRDAANALIQWCNSQDIGREDALCILEMVLAKLIMDHSKSDVVEIEDELRLHLKRTTAFCVSRINWKK